MKDKQRETCNKIAELCFQSGDFHAAYKNYMRNIENLRNGKDHLDFSLAIIRNSIQMSNFAHIPNYVTKAEDPSGNMSPLLKDLPDAAAELKVASALCFLESSRYLDCAKKLQDVSFNSVAKLNHIISIEDIAVYASLCALAEYTRPNLNLLLHDSNFQTYLEQVPQAAKMLKSYFTSDYAQCLSILEVFKNDLQLDIHMNDHIGNLYEKIRHKALKEYFLPYASVDLQKMAAAFQTTVPPLEREICKLILAGQMNARIDSFNQRLVKREIPLRAQVYQKTIASGEDFETNSRAMLLRVNLLMNNMMVKPTKFEGRSNMMGMDPRMAGMGAMHGMHGMPHGMGGKRY